MKREFVFVIPTYSLITDSTSKVTNKKTFIVSDLSMSLESRVSGKSETEVIVPCPVHLCCEMGGTALGQFRLLIKQAEDAIPF